MIPVTNACATPVPWYKNIKSLHILHGKNFEINNNPINFEIQSTFRLKQNGIT